MPGPGEYLADVTEGITRVENLPKAKVIKRSRSYKRSIWQGPDHESLCNNDTVS